MLTLDPGWAKCALALRTGFRLGHGPHEIRTQSLQSVWDQLEARRKRLARGDTMEILHAIAYCAEENTPLPTWLANAYRRTLLPFLRPGGPSSLDAVFHSQRLPTNTRGKIERARQDWQLGAQIYFAIWEIAPKHTAMDSALDEVLRAKRWGVEKTKARALVMLVETAHCELTGIESLSRFWTIRRKLMRDT